MEDLQKDPEMMTTEELVSQKKMDMVSKYDNKKSSYKEDKKTTVKKDSTLKNRQKSPLGRTWWNSAFFCYEIFVGKRCHSVFRFPVVEFSRKCIAKSSFLVVRHLLPSLKETAKCTPKKYGIRSASFWGWLRVVF